MKYSRLFIFSLILVMACNRKPDYDEVPVIAFNEERTEIHRNIYSSLADDNCDSIKFAIDFQDGDGDLGLNDDDRLDASNINFIMIEQLKVDGEWFQNEIYNEQFPLLSPKELHGPIDGTIFNIKQIFYKQFLLPNDTLRFIIKIKDRAGHFSNTIESPEFIIKKQ